MRSVGCWGAPAQGSAAIKTGMGRWHFKESEGTERKVAAPRNLWGREAKLELSESLIDRSNPWKHPDFTLGRLLNRP